MKLEMQEGGGSIGEMITCSVEKRAEGKLLGTDALWFVILYTTS